MRLIEEILYRKTKGLHVQIVLPRREDELLPLIECGCTQMLLQIRDILEDPQMRKEGCCPANPLYPVSVCRRRGFAQKMVTPFSHTV